MGKRNNLKRRKMTKTTKPSKKAAVEDVFESPSEDKDLKSEPPVDLSEDSRDSLHSEDSGKAVRIVTLEPEDLCFRSKYITDKLAHIFMDTDSDEEFEGFANDEKTSHRGRKRTKSLDSEEDSEEDTGFYSEGEGAVPPRRQSSGLCVAFRFPVKKNSSLKTQAAAIKPQNGKPAVKRSRAPGGRQTRQRATVQPPSRPQRAVVTAKRRGKELSDEEEVEEEEEEKVDDDEAEEMPEAETQALSKRARNIQENKAMLAKLFADLNAMEQISPLTTPKKKKSHQKKSVSEAQGERRNPSRKARPRDHFGIEEDLPKLVKQFTLKKEDLRRLVEKVDSESHGGKQKRRSKMNRSYLPVEDITEDDLTNVADRASDKILDKENGSTCHQCRQKTLDTKTVCRSPDCVGVKGQFCGPCLRNRYGEDVRTALLDPEWECPICRGMCNCSLCRKRDGRCATGALTRLAKHYGHGSVRDYLDSLQKQLS
ncbi:cell division cycle-associated 7-like protein isoform X1 [Alosa alosa]|uniref:cell division cycle-associated 7-like protein isoform X1 n=2 Tax=Alosa alosa TaxID=278164 RepID=UPI002015038B|nr:cell division cycle-associated 7-like protein isoform X1 [Alosa alosa]